ncbi:MAG: 4-(cytidine 5'-diphospho)-2-C-methyl-D-erythritol kinase [Armatimonadetes bacterium]|nr:4-(cytidine 5'-diphospho)-2-C-methyl-D-erythritol kinase [Armatimonadota bacterium]
MIVRCPAKVNLFLSVGQRDETGYHPIRTVFQAVGLFDELTVNESESDSFDCDWPDIPAENTVTAALRLLQREIAIPPLGISLVKRIPRQAGLGGGSSDAAGLIRAVRKLIPDQLTDTAAQRIALAVGADVPFFLMGGRATACGYGEKLEAQPDDASKWFLIVMPSTRVDTSEAYTRLDALNPSLKTFPAAGGLHNDFEAVAPFECAQLSDRLRVHGAEDALLCGSGSAVFGMFDSASTAGAAQAKMQEEGVGDSWLAPALTREESLWIS